MGGLEGPYQNGLLELRQRIWGLGCRTPVSGLSRVHVFGFMCLGVYRLRGLGLRGLGV